MNIEAKLREMGLALSEAPKPLAAYVPAVQAGDYIYTSGQLPSSNGKLQFTGKLGKEVSEEQGYEAAKLCILNCLSVIKALIGSLDNVEQIVKVVGFVNSAEGFTMQPKVVNGASELLGVLFAEKGRHARSDVGVSELPLGAACEIEMVVKVKV